jgi:chemosensory pili system protein ChpA (sensor histidine kinase/response regulator)
MDEELLQGFIEEAEGYLPTIRRGIEIYAADHAQLEDLKTSYRQVHTIKGAALMVGLPDIGAFAKTLQDALDEIVSANAILSRGRAAALLGEVARLEKMFVEIGNADVSAPEQENKAATNFETNAVFPLDEGCPPTTVTDGELRTADDYESDEFFALDDSIFEPEISGTTTTAATAESEPEKFAAADFEIDAEMREVFALEAEEHLRSITANLSLLERDARDRNALLEIRRSSHTLKGSAGIVGFQKIASLAHAQEDLLDFLAENESEIPAPENKSIVKILLAATDCLEALSAGQNSPELEQKIHEIQEGFRRLLERLKMAATAATAAAGAATEPAETQSSVSPAVSFGAPAAEAPRPEEAAAVPAQAIDEAAAAADIHATQSANANLNSNQNQNQNPTVIRVSLERLDDLVRLVSQLVVSRSAFEQRLTGLRRQIEELHQSTRRLQRLSGKIETDFASSALEGGGGAANCLPNQQASHNLFGRESFNAGDGRAATDEEFDFLELDRYTEFHQTARELSETASDAAAVNAELDALTNHLGLLFDAQRGLFDEMQDKLLRLRMVPFATLSSRLQRTVRVTADEEEGKAVDFFIEGETLEIDSEILHFIVEPLLHLLRNAVAHGVEPAETRRLLGKPAKGRITLSVTSEGAHIVLTVTDDGRGISAAALKEKAVAVGFVSAAEAEAMTDDDAFSLIFLPGLSTAEKVNQVSGRGVGMNVVKSSVLRQQGSISVKSEAQKGTTFTLRIPTALAVTRVLLVKANNQTFAFPLKIVRRVTEISRREFEEAKAAGVLRLEGRNLAVAHLNELLGFPTAPAAAFSPDARVLILLIETAETAQALAVEQILKPEEVVIKPLGGPLKSLAEFLGATVLGDGEVVPILDLIPLLAAAAGRRRKIYAPVENRSSQNETPKPKTALSVLIVDDSPSVRQINSRTIKNAGWLPIAAKDGLEALELLEAAAATVVSGESELPDVILTDVEMPRMDGYELLAALKQRENLRRIPVVMITSRGGDKHRRKAFDLGVSEYLTKPYEDSVLIEKVKSLARV